ncbi:hypothetical protein OO013_11565 [Mangrovivirga sp. M17]|uniref:Uncharacterized protein n=1 Tax=Mangrovivirga halotolerans TaxID=2993936 RepID=A0ABT3RT28_9BACT|nr:hypothetical protein [Mangrovivirga halotolerans]MCX2744508.1 hypothetical protein [Mangrovivirga halotolerans]
MKKDILERKAEKIGVALSKQRTGEWQAYFINFHDACLKNVLINSCGMGEIEGKEVKTSVLRHIIDSVGPGKAVAFESMVEEVFKLDNEFKITYFKENQLYDGVITFKSGSINKDDTEYIEEIGEEVVISKL